MPKENVNDIVMDQLRAEVTWKTDPDGQGVGYVQLATVHTDSPAVILAETIDSAPAGEVKVTINGEPTQGVTTGSGRLQMWDRVDGWHVTLDREQINRLIRVLRRARDSAFGSDA